MEGMRFNRSIFLVYDQRANRTGASSEFFSGVSKQRFEAKIHVLLDMTVKQRKAWLVGDELHRDPSERGNDHSVLHDPASGLAVDLNDLEQVPVNVYRVTVVTSIVKHQSVPLSLSKHEFALVRIFFPVDEPVVDPVRSARYFFKDHIDNLVRSGKGTRLPKYGVVPLHLCRRNPLRLRLRMIRVLHHDAHSRLPRGIAQLA